MYNVTLDLRYIEFSSLGMTFMQSCDYGKAPLSTVLCFIWSVGLLVD